MSEKYSSASERLVDALRPHIPIALAETAGDYEYRLHRWWRITPDTDPLKQQIATQLSADRAARNAGGG